jgi:hypothetical protein
MISKVTKTFPIELKIIFKHLDYNNDINEKKLLKTLLSDINVELENANLNFTENTYDIKITDIYVKK